MIALFLIGAIASILSDETIPHEYAMVGLLLLIFYKLPMRLLPVLALLCFIVPTAKRIVDLWNAKVPIVNTATQIQNTITVDSTILESYVGVYQFPNTQRTVTREGNNIFWGDPGGGRHDKLVAESETKFINPLSKSTISFVKDSSGNIASLNFQQNGVGNVISASKLKISIDSARKNFIQKPSYKEFVVNNAKSFWNRFKTWSWSNFFWSYDISGILSFFLIGLYAGHKRIFYDVDSNKGFLEKVKWWGFIIGTIGMLTLLVTEAWNYIHHIPDGSYTVLTRFLFGVAWSIGVMAMTFAYVAALKLLLQNDKWKKKLAFLAPVGRMGLTNYLLHIIPYVVIFHYGFNLTGKVGPFYRLLMALPVYVALIFWSRWWFKHFSIGPAEWLWRSLTYLKFQPMRLENKNENQTS